MSAPAGHQGGGSLATELEQQGVAGRIITPVGDVYRKARRLVQGDPRTTMGLAHLLPATLTEVVDGVSKLSGSDLPAEGDGDGDGKCWVDASVLVGLADAARERLIAACDRGETVLFGTGHPAGPIDLYVRLAAAMAGAGARVQRFAEAEYFDLDVYHGRGQIRYVGEVACLSAGGELLHTHSPRPMEYLLDVGHTPDLVVGDHGFAGAGLARGADAVALVDTNDPALVLAWMRGLPIHPMVCDDNRPPSCYHALADHLTAGIA